MPPSLPVYHFTHIAFLPWILQAGELRAGGSGPKAFFYPQPDFIWATTDNRGAPSCRAHYGYSEGITPLVRITLHGADFEPWPDVAWSAPAWLRWMELCETTARNCGDNPTCWRCRTAPLPLSRVISIETKARHDPNWLPFVQPFRRSDSTLCIVLDGVEFCSTRNTPHDGNYRLTTIDRAAGAAGRGGGRGGNLLVVGWPK
jgi:hypothetical protein